MALALRTVFMWQCKQGVLERQSYEVWLWPAPRTHMSTSVFMASHMHTHEHAHKSMHNLMQMHNTHITHTHAHTGTM